MSENQRSDEEIGENQRRDEEIGQNQRSDEETAKNLWGAQEAARCIVSDPAQPHNLTPRAGSKTKAKCFSCGKRSTCWEVYDSMNFHYCCTICQVEFHSECYETPSKMIHPYHPQHPLTYTYLDYETGNIFNTNCADRNDINYNPIGFQETFEPISNPRTIFDKCTWCGRDLHERFYRCLICNFSLDIRCAKTRPPLTIQNPKSHHHSLSLFPRALSFPCNACGLISLLEPGYACYQCNYVVHQSCIDLPRIIKLTRHPHRLSYTPYLPTKVSSCQICYKNVDIKYGQYSCNHEDCSYVAHSKCATHIEVWDWEELEWEPEESDETTVLAPYKKVGVGLIEHFCHDHHFLKLEKYNYTRDSGKQCQACMRCITSHDFYNCVECDYFLHEVCANLPRQLDHALHNHSLFLDPYQHWDYFELHCDACWRWSSGWKYICKKECTGYNSSNYQVDVNCILVPECFTHESHPQHLLFISTTYFQYGSRIHCQGCMWELQGSYLRCTRCEFAICFKCSTIPYELYYKFDELPLSLCYGESSMDGIYWCEVCEKILKSTKWFYTNKERCTTIHHKCLFGAFAYMKFGHTVEYNGLKVEIVSNSSSRPICRNCQYRCPHSLYLRVYMLDKSVDYFCSFSCLDKGTRNED